MEQSGREWNKHVVTVENEWKRVEGGASTEVPLGFPTRMRMSSLHRPPSSASIDYPSGFSRYLSENRSNPDHGNLSGKARFNLDLILW